MKKIPAKITLGIREKLWKEADDAGWTNLTSQQKTSFYEQWSKAPGIGNVLETYLDGKNVRVYIKDVIMKPYGRARIQNAAGVFELLGIPADCRVRKDFVKPHGRILEDGRTIAWGLGREWKTILLAVFERAYRAKRAVPFAVILLNSEGKMRQPFERAMVEDAAKKLGIAVVHWTDISNSPPLEDPEPMLL